MAKIIAVQPELKYFVQSNQTRSVFFNNKEEKNRKNILIQLETKKLNYS